MAPEIMKHEDSCKTKVSQDGTERSWRQQSQRLRCLSIMRHRGRTQESRSSRRSKMAGRPPAPPYFHLQTLLEQVELRDFIHHTKELE